MKMWFINSEGFISGEALTYLYFELYNLTFPKFKTYEKI